MQSQGADYCRTLEHAPENVAVAGYRNVGVSKPTNDEGIWVHHSLAEKVDFQFGI
jgi:hypothetical protein